MPLAVLREVDLGVTSARPESDYFTCHRIGCGVAIGCRKSYALNSSDSLAPFFERDGSLASFLTTSRTLNMKVICHSPFA
jgi:hypothetical protein